LKDTKMKKTIFFTAALALLSLGFVDTLQAGIYPGRVTSAPTSNSGRAVWLLSPGAGPFFCDQSGGDCYQDLGGFVWFNDEVAGGNPPPENPSNTGNFAPTN
jgi:hypothetical protein